VGVVPCLETRESVLDGAGRDAPGVGGCVRAEDEFVSGELQCSWDFFLLAEGEEVGDVSRVAV